MYKQLSVIASAIVWILLPKCSVCLLAYMSLFSALGLGHLITNPYTLPVIKLLLAINLLASLYLALKGKQYFYAAISMICALSFVINKLYIDSVAMNIITGSVLVGAVIRIRLLRVHKKKCVFAVEGEAAC